MQPYDKQHASEAASTPESSVRYDGSSSPPSQTSVGRVGVIVVVALLVSGGGLYLAFPDIVSPFVTQLLLDVKLSDPKSAVSAFLNAAVAQNNPGRFLAPGTNGSAITQRYVLRYEIKNVAEDVVSAIVWRRGVQHQEVGKDSGCSNQRIRAFVAACRPIELLSSQPEQHVEEPSPLQSANDHGPLQSQAVQELLWAECRHAH